MTSFRQIIDRAMREKRFLVVPGVHDALSALLNQITGKNFDYVYNGASTEGRERNRRSWIAWCKTTYPDELKACSDR